MVRQASGRRGRRYENDPVMMVHRGRNQAVPPGIRVGRNESENRLGESTVRCDARFLQRTDGRKGKVQLFFEIAELWVIRGQGW